MKQMIFQGPLVNLGRWGFVNKNDTLAMTDKEAGAINGDKRFVLLKPGQEKPKPGHFLAETDRMVPEELRDIRNHNRAEQARLDRLAALNSEETVLVAELRECSFSDLTERAHQHKVDYDQNTSKHDLMRRIATAMLKKTK
jgi:hypothetical protein